MAERQNRRAIGTAYEQQAARFLENQGHLILERNFRCRFGEIDLISKKDGVLVFSEVKFRSTAGYGDPMEAVTAKKQKTISDVASYYLYRNRIPEDVPCRFDVIAVSEQSIRVYENAFSYQGRFRW